MASKNFPLGVCADHTTLWDMFFALWNISSKCSLVLGLFEKINEESKSKSHDYVFDRISKDLFNGTLLIKMSVLLLQYVVNCSSYAAFNRDTTKLKEVTILKKTFVSMCIIT